MKGLCTIQVWYIIMKRVEGRGLATRNVLWPVARRTTTTEGQLSSCIGYIPFRTID